MPEICRFYGIILSLYWRDHNPPHIHFTYGDYECSISVIDRVVDGKAPAKVILKVNQWIDSMRTRFSPCGRKLSVVRKLERLNH